MIKSILALLALVVAAAAIVVSCITYINVRRIRQARMEVGTRRGRRKPNDKID